MSVKQRCAAKQLEILDEWLQTEDLTLTPENVHCKVAWAYQERSPLDFFKSFPITGPTDGPHGGFCGLRRLVANMRRDGREKLLDWMATTRHGAQVASDDHIAYMAEQKRKLSEILD